MELIDKNIDEITDLCRKNKVAVLYTFGSVNTDKFTSESDIDFIVDFDSDDPIEYSDYYFNLKFALQKLFKRSIDLLEMKALTNPYLKDHIDKSKVLIYG